MESLLQEQVCQYLRFCYPTVLFRSDFAAGLKLTKGQAIKHKRMQAGRAWPDLFICAPRDGYHGLFIELKREGVRVYKRDGELVADAHIAEQAAVLAQLQGLGFRAEFASGFEQAKELIDEYLGHPAEVHPTTRVPASSLN